MFGSGIKAVRPVYNDFNTKIRIHLVKKDVWRPLKGYLRSLRILLLLIKKCLSIRIFSGTGISIK